MSNILNHNRNNIVVDLNLADYWDFQLALSQNIQKQNVGLTTKCLSSYIDIENPDCVWFDDTLYSTENYIWADSVNDGCELVNIGYTGIDNGLVNFKKDRTSNKQFLNLFFNSRHSIKNGDMRLILNKVHGNNQLYDYFTCITDEDNHQSLKLNGGFYQGFFKLYNNNYKVLPTHIGVGWTFEITLKRKDFNERTNTTLNDVHPKNKGMFFYVGTRSENKWYKYYNVVESIDKSYNTYTSNEYCKEIATDDDNLNDDYIKSINTTDYTTNDYVEGYLKTNPKSGKYVKDDYIKGNYIGDPCDCCAYYFNDEYLKKDTYIDPNMELKTSDGYDVKQPNIIEYETDNKFLLFDHTKDGFTIDKWNENTKAIFNDIKVPTTENYFTLFNRTKNGHTIDTVNDILSQKSKQYSILKDLYRNALGFQITDDGNIGYKYLIRDCECENEECYKIESEFSKANAVSKNNWHTIHITITPNVKKEINHKCENPTSVTDQMTIMIYVDGNLKLISKKLPILNIKPLDDLASKQEGVPYNVSLGGGTQGLCDVIYPNFRKTPDDVLPLEKEFGGTFIGFIKSFRFYNCPLNVCEIRNNYRFDSEILKPKDIYKKD